MRLHIYKSLLALFILSCAEKNEVPEKDFECKGGGSEYFSTDLTDASYEFESCYDLEKNIPCESVAPLQDITFDAESAELRLQDERKIDLEFDREFASNESRDPQIDRWVVPRYRSLCPTATGHLGEQQCLKMNGSVAFTNGLTVTLRELTDQRCENIGEENCSLGMSVLGLLEVQAQGNIIKLPFGDQLGIPAMRLDFEDSVLSINRADYGDGDRIYLTLSANEESVRPALYFHDSQPSCTAIIPENPSKRRTYKATWTAMQGDGTFLVESFLPKNDKLGFSSWEQAFYSETLHCEVRTQRSNSGSTMTVLGDLLCSHTGKNLSSSVRFECSMERVD